jgi:hypothetical protein
MDSPSNPFDLDRINTDFVSSLPCVALRSHLDLPEGSAVYFISIKFPDFKVLYVGMSERVKKRFATHFLREDFGVIDFACAPVYIHYFEMNRDRADLEIMETAFIKRLDPPFNRRDNPSVETKKYLLKQAHDVPTEKREEIVSKLACRLNNLKRKDLENTATFLHLKSANNKSKAVLIKYIETVLGDLYDPLNYPDHTPDKIVMFPKPSAKEKIQLDKLVENIDKYKSVNFNHLELIEYDAKDLRQMASDFGVNRYSYMTKFELVKNIIQRFDLYMSNYVENNKEHSIQ